MVLSNDSNHTKRIFIYLLYSKRSKKSGEGKYVLWLWSAGLESGSKVITSSLKVHPIDPAFLSPIVPSSVTALSSPFSVMLQGFAYAC